MTENFCLRFGKKLVLGVPLDSGVLSLCKVKWHGTYKVTTKLLSHDLDRAPLVVQIKRKH